MAVLGHHRGDTKGAQKKGKTNFISLFIIYAPYNYLRLVFAKNEIIKTQF